MVARLIYRGAALLAALAGVYIAAIRPWHLRWGATGSEVQRAMPGDDLVPHPHLAATRAITVAAPAAAIWPWLVQMGYRRAGWYSYDWIDNDGIHVETIIPELQHLQVGDMLLTGPTGGFRVEAIDPERSLVLAIRDPDGTVSCTIMLVPLDPAQTRLVFRLRLRVARSLRGLGFLLVMDAGDFVMMRKQLLGIKRRAEAASRGRLSRQPFPRGVASDTHAWREASMSDRSHDLQTSCDVSTGGTGTIAAGLRIDPAQVATAIEHLVCTEVARLHKRGVVLGLSGGLDSSVCAFLCVRALGRKRVKTLILPERDSDPQNMRDAALVARELGLHPTQVDLTPLLKRLGVYRGISRRQAANRGGIEAGIRWIARLTHQPSVFGTGMTFLFGGDRDPWSRLARVLLWRPVGRIYAFAITKARMRMVVLYQHAMLHDCLVIGTTDKSEWSVGFFDRYGDGANDLALLRHLYKTQIRTLAHYLGVPAQIITKPSSGDLAAGLPNETIIGLSYEQLDAVLWGIEHHLSARAIATQAGVVLPQIAAVRRAMETARIIAALPAHL